MNKLVDCNKCGQIGLVWHKSKKGNWYLAVETNWTGDMFGANRSFYPAHDCERLRVEHLVELENAEGRLVEALKAEKILSDLDSSSPLKDGIVYKMLKENIEKYEYVISKYSFLKEKKDSVNETV